MRRDRKPVGRWIGEAFLIFLSVLCAFYIDNYRESKSQDRLYIRYLKDFKSDLEENQRKFRNELAPVYNIEDATGYIDGTLKDLDFYDSLLSLRTRQSAEMLLTLIENKSLRQITEWIFTSPQYEKLSSQYYSFIKSDSLRDRLELHKRNNINRTEIKGRIIDHLIDLEDITDDLNFDTGATLSNRTILFSNRLINKVRHIRESYESLKGFTSFSKRNDSILLNTVNSELKLLGERTEED